MAAEEKSLVSKMWSDKALREIQEAGSLRSYLFRPIEKLPLSKRIKYWLLYDMFPWRIRRCDDYEGYDG